MGTFSGMIAGGGLVGLTLALALHKKGIKARVYEAVKKIRPLGVGVNLLPHSVQNLEKLGLLPELEKVAIKTSSLAYYTEDGKTIWREPRGLDAGYDVPQFSIHRGDFHMILLNAARERLGAENIVSGHHFQSFEQDRDGVTAHFTDRETGEAVGTARGDFMVGADGINSRLRQIFYPDEGPPKYSGQMLWRGVTEMEPFLDGRSMFMAGHNDLKLVAYPIRSDSAKRGKSYINWIAERRIPSDLATRSADWNEKGLIEEFKPYFASWNLGWLDINRLFDNAISIHKFPMVDRDPLPQWSFGRVTLMGDAAHAMYPNGSNGVSQGVLDAMTFADLMENATDIETTLTAYDDARREATAKISLANRQTGPELVMQMVKDQCPGTCGETHSCIPKDVLEEVATAYKKLAGFDKQTLKAAR